MGSSRKHPFPYLGLHFENLKERGVLGSRILKERGHLSLEFPKERGELYLIDNNNRALFIHQSIVSAIL